MIDKHYIDTAIKIRREYLTLNDKLGGCENEMRLIKENLLKETTLLDDINKNLSKYKTPEEAQEAVFLKLNEIDVQRKKLFDIYKPIDDRLKELGKQEVILYQAIKRAYPNTTDEDIVEEINKYIDK